MKAEMRLDYRAVPGSYEAERVLLTTMLRRPDSLVEILSQITEDDFLSEEHKAIYHIILGLFEKGEPVDMVRVLVEHKKIAHSTAVSDLYRDEFVGDWRANIKTVKDLSRRRRILRALFDASQLIGGSGVIDEVVSDLIGKLNDVGEGGKRPIPLDRVVLLSQKRIEQALERKSQVTGIPTGFEKFDRELGGIQPGELMIVGARPSVGKSALLAGLAVGVAKHGYPSLIVNAEMELVDVGTRMLAQFSKVPNTDLRRGDLEEGDFSRLVTAAATLSSLPIWIYDDTRWEVIKAQVRALKNQCPALALVAIDYIQRIKVESEPGEKRYEKIGRVAREAKDLAKDLRIGVVVAAQLSRAVEKEAKEPQLIDFRECGDLEQEADIASFLHCYKPKTESWSLYWLIRKNRNGPLAAIHLKFVGNDVAFYDWEEGS